MGFITLAQLRTELLFDLKNRSDVGTADGAGFRRIHRDARPVRNRDSGAVLANGVRRNSGPHSGINEPCDTLSAHF